MPTKRRFIAGAVCPKCKQIDKTIVVERAKDRKTRQCISCGFDEPAPSISFSQELPTRLTASKIDEQVQPISLKL